MALSLGIIRAGRSVRAWRQHRCAESGAPALVDSDDCYVQSYGQRSVAGVGLRGLVIVDSGDAVLV